MRIAFTRWRSGGLLNRTSPRKKLLPKKKTSSGFEFVSGLADGASAMPAKWSRPVFSFRFYEGKISRALIVSGDFRGLRLPPPRLRRLAGDACKSGTTRRHAAARPRLHTARLRAVPGAGRDRKRVRHRVQERRPVRGCPRPDCVAGH